MPLPRRLTVVLLAATSMVLTSLTGVGHADNTRVSMGPPNAARTQQVLTISVTGAPGAWSWATYRKVADPDHLATQDTSCAPTVATNHDTVLYAALPASPTITMARTIPIGLMVICFYRSDQTADLSLAGKAASNLLGQWVPGMPPAITKPALKPTTLTVGLVRSRTGGTISGRVTGLRTASVSVQRRVGRTWRNVKVLPVRSTRFSGPISVTKGQVLRVVLMVPKGYRSSSTLPFPVR